MDPLSQSLMSSEDDSLISGDSEVKSVSEANSSILEEEEKMSGTARASWAEQWKTVITGQCYKGICLCQIC